MGDWPLSSGQAWEQGGALSASTAGTTVTASASTNTKGSWTALIAATARAGSALVLTVADNNSTDQAFLIDIGVGSAGSEVVLIPDVFVAFQRANLAGQSVMFPVAVPAGARVSARCQSSTASATVAIIVQVLAAGIAQPEPYQRVTAYGVNAATSQGVTCDAGGTIHTLVRTQLVASTTNPIKQGIFAISHKSVTGKNDSRFLFDLAVGAAGSEIVVLPSVYVFQSNLSDNICQFFYGPFPLNVPAATRLSINVQCSNNAAASRILQIGLYGLD